MNRIQTALAPTGIPSYAGAYRATTANARPPGQYIVYTTMLTEDGYTDDTLRRYRLYVYLNLWSETDPTAAALAIRRAMRAAGFAMIEETTRDTADSAYESSTRQYTVAYTWVADEEADDGV